MRGRARFGSAITCEPFLVDSPELSAQVRAMLGVPNKFVAGDSLSATFPVPGHPPSDGWLVVYFFRGPSALDVAAVADGDLWRLALTTSNTAGLVAGFYTVAGTATRQGERFTFESGVIQVEASISGLTEGHDARTHAQKVLEKIEAVLEGRADKSILRNSIDGLEIEHASHADLLKFRAMYVAEVRAEKRALNPSSGNVLVQFVN